MKTIGLLTSGGDAPGMNPAIRAVVRTAIYHGLGVVGIQHGYAGLLEKEFIDMDVSSVGDIVTRGGTILYSARCPSFRQEAVQDQAARLLKERGIEGLVVIGGDGSFKGALALEERGIPVVGIPGTIDNDIKGTHYTIGFDTAVNTALEAISKLRDTATSHERLFLVEVMGRDSGAIALATGIAGGAEAILVPEFPLDLDALVDKINQGNKRGKISSIVVLAEGCASIDQVAKRLREGSDSTVRTVTLGHLQRGGSPTVRDAILASRMGYHAVQFLRDYRAGVMTAVVCDEIVQRPLKDCLKKENKMKEELYQLAGILAI